MSAPGYQPLTGVPCGCRKGAERDNCRTCEGSGMVVDHAAIRARRPMAASIQIQWDEIIVKASAKLVGTKTVSEESHRIGMERGEPLLVMLDSLIKYAVAYAKRYDEPLANDYHFGPIWMDMIRSLRAMENGDGAIAMSINRSTDSKDNGVIEEACDMAMKLAGFKATE